MQLLFFDTFSHDSASCSDLNLDLVQFPSPVYVKEVRVVPLGARVSANFPGGVRLGATNPTKFDLEFFVNNLRAPGASTFESIGVLKYSQNETISMVSSKTVATDGLVLRGHYSTITLAVYGVLSDASHDQLARQANPQTHNSKNPLDIRVKEEPVRPPESPIPDGNGRTIGESYAATWTAKHSEEALKAEPPEEWLAHEGGWNRSIKVETDLEASRTKNIKEEEKGPEYKENNNLNLNKVKKEGVNQYGDGSTEYRSKVEVSRYRSGSRSPGYRSPGYPLTTRSRDVSLDRDRYRSRSRDGSRDRLKSREGSHESYPRRSYENSLKDSFRPRSRNHSIDRYRESAEREKYPVSVRAHSPGIRSPARKHTPSRPNSSSRPLTPARLRTRSRTPRGYRSPKLDLSPPYRRDASRDYSPAGRASAARSQAREVSPRVQGGRDYCRDRSPRGRSYSRDRSPRPRDYSRDCSPRAREYSRDGSPRDYDKNSHHSSGSRRHHSPRRSHSPRNLHSVSPRRRSLTPRKKRSLSPRYGPHRSRSRSPFDRRSRSPDLWGKRPFSPRYSRSPAPHPPGSRNGFRETSPPPAVLQPAAGPVLDSEILDNVSDISEGDIPDLPEPEPEEQTEVVVQTSITRTYISREDIEEISDEEAEWSDDFEPLGFSDSEFDLETETVNPVKVFNPLEAELKPLLVFTSPANYIYPNRVRNLPASKEGSEGVLNLVSKLDTISEIDERWIELLEQLTGQLQEEPGCSIDVSIHPAVIRLACLGLNYDVALQQSRPANKLRHIKSGIKFVLELMEVSELVMRELLNSGVISKLWSLFLQQFMTIPGKLLILRTIDRTLDSNQGMEQVVMNNGSGSLYQEIVEILAKNESTRTKFALSSLVNKIHLYELVLELKELSSSLQDGQVFSALESGIKELGRIYCNLESISHPSRYLPCGRRFNMDQEIFNRPERGFFSIMATQEVISLLSSVLEVAGTDVNLTSCIYALLYQWVNSLPGLLFLSSRTIETNRLISIFLRTNSTEPNPFSPSPASPQPMDTSETLPLVNGIDCKPNLINPSAKHCGLTLVHRIHALQCIDNLRFEEDGSEDRRGMETSQILEVIQVLYGMTLTGQGLGAVVHVLCLGDNIETVLVLTNHSSMDGQKDMKKSAVRGYANELLLLCVRLSENVDFLSKYAKVLLDLGKHDEHSKLSELVNWTRPCGEQESITVDCIPALLDSIKKNVESSSHVSQEVITCLRILAHLTIPQYPNRMRGMKNGLSSDLKYHYACLLLYSSEGVQCLVSLLDKLCEEHSQPALHTATLVGTKGGLILALLKPTLAILNYLLDLVISARGSDYHDVTPLGTLIRCYTLLAVVPASSAHYIQAKECSEDIVETLLSFTKPTLSPDKDDISKSLWTEMLREVLNHVIKSPCFYIPGLSLLSQLLPLPLPMPSARPLSEEEKGVVLNSRKLWSAHLHPLQEELGRLVEQVVGVVYPPLLQLVKQVCEQLVGLAPPVAVCILQGVVRTCTSALQSKAMIVSGRNMNFLSWISSLPHVLSVIYSQLQEESFRTELSRTLELCFTQGSDVCQESAISVIQSLCDPTISLRTKPLGSVEGWDQYLSDSLPDGNSLLELVRVLLNPYTFELKTNHSIQLLSIRTFKMFTRNDHSFSKLKLCLNTKHRTLFSFLRNLATDFDPGDPVYVDCLTVTVEFLRMLVVPGAEQDGYPARIQVLSVPELAWLLQYNIPQESEEEGDEKKKEHPLKLLQNSIQDHYEAYPNLNQTKFELEALMEQLENLEVGGSGVEGLEVEEEESILPSPTPLLTQWDWRQVTVDPEQTDHLTQEYWFGLHTSSADTGLADEREETDLLDLNSRYLPELNLVQECLEVCKESSLALERKKKVKKSALETKALYNKSIISTFKSGGQINLRTQRFNRGAFTRPDPFRTRPPNTSRPPSLHVDDFLVLELKGQQPTGPTGYNKQSIKAAKELFAQREAAAALKPPSQFREATREPVLPPPFRGRGRGQDRGRGFRGNGQRAGFRRDSRGWSPEGYRTSEPRDLGREARPGPREDRRFRGRGERRGWERGGRGRDKFGGRGGKDRDERPRHGRNFTR